MALPFVLLLPTPGITKDIPAHIGPATLVQVEPSHTFPDMRQNYEKTIVEPREAAQAAAAAQQDQLSAKQAASAYTAPTQPVAVAPSGTGDDFYKSYIYTHESGNDPTRWNSEGCVGLGQACPASKLTAVCPNLDYACEDSFFTSYAVARYGSWAGAYAYWTVHHNW